MKGLSFIFIICLCYSGSVTQCTPDGRRGSCSVSRTRCEDARLLVDYRLGNRPVHGGHRCVRRDTDQVCFSDRKSRRTKLSRQKKRIDKNSRNAHKTRRNMDDRDVEVDVKDAAESRRLRGRRTLLDIAFSFVRSTESIILRRVH